MGAECEALGEQMPGWLHEAQQALQQRQTESASADPHEGLPEWLSEAQEAECRSFEADIVVSAVRTCSPLNLNFDFSFAPDLVLKASEADGLFFAPLAPIATTRTLYRVLKRRPVSLATRWSPGMSIPWSRCSGTPLHG